MVGCAAVRRLPHLLAMAPLVCTLAACSSDSNTDALRLAKLVYQQLTASFAENSIPRERVASIPYATVGVRLGGGPESLLVLTNISRNDLQFVGGTAISITLRDGRIIRAVGLNHNLDGFQGPIADKAGTPNGQGGYHYIYDLADRNAYGVFVRCTQSDTGAETIEIIGVHHNTRHIVERCEAPQLGWTFQNEFWADAATGYVWRSTQSINPDLSPLTIQVLRPEKG
jgi:hypothetical protein